MLLAHLKPVYERLRFENVVLVVADEMKGRKGHNNLTVFADLVPIRADFDKAGKDATVLEAPAGGLLRYTGYLKAIQFADLNISRSKIKEWPTD
jgi:hypothetical protein